MRHAVLMLLLMLPVYAFAHDIGASFEKDVGEYRIDVGYTPPSPQPGDQIVFDFNLKKGTVDQSFEYVWVRILNDQSVVVATGVVRATFGPTSLLLSIPKDAHALSVDVRYQKGDTTLAETSFPLPLTPSKTSMPVSWEFLAGAALLGFMIGVAYMKLRRKQAMV